MKPIEEGCTAIVTDSFLPENIGKIVRVGKYIGKVDSFEDENQWEVCPGMLCVAMINGDVIGTEMVNHQSESRLQRLNDTDENELVKTEIEERV